MEPDMPATMRAMIVRNPGPPDVLEPVRLPIPAPGPGQARVRVAYVGMNPVDALVRREAIAWMPVTYPLVPGLEHSGVVDAVGEGVDPAMIGRRVIARVGFGGYAEWSVSPAATMIALDDRIDLKTGCVYRGCSSTAWHALHKSVRLQPGESVLVHSAAGAVGAMAMQIAAAHGASVVGLAGGPAKVAYARRFNPTIVDYLPPDWPEHALAANGGRKFDVILDGNGGPSAEANYRLIAPAGRILLIGATSGQPAAPVAVPALIAGSFSVGGMTLRQIEQPPGGPFEQVMADAVASGRWIVPVGETVPLADVASLHARLEGRALVGRAVVAVNEGLDGERPIPA
jgi:NADPH2:quinone reductase